MPVKTVRIILAGMPKFLQEIVQRAIPVDAGVEIVGRTRSVKGARALFATTQADVIVVEGGLEQAAEAVSGQASIPTVIGICTSRKRIVSYDWSPAAADVGDIEEHHLSNAIRAAFARRPEAGGPDGSGDAG